MAGSTEADIQSIVDSVDISDEVKAAATAEAETTPAKEEASPAASEEEAVATETPSDEKEAVPQVTPAQLSAYQKALAKHGKDPEKLGQDYWRIQNRAGELGRKVKELEAKLAQKPAEPAPAAPIPAPTQVASPAAEVAPEIAQIDADISRLEQAYHQIQTQALPQVSQAVRNAEQNADWWLEKMTSLDPADPEFANAKQNATGWKAQYKQLRAEEGRLTQVSQQIVNDYKRLESDKSLRLQLHEMSEARKTEAKAREEAKLREEQEALESEAIAYKEAEWLPAVESVITAKVPEHLREDAAEYVDALANKYLDSIDPETNQPRSEGEGIADEAAFINQAVDKFMGIQRKAAQQHAQQKQADVKKAGPAPGKATAKTPEITKEARSVEDVLAAAGVL